MKKVILFAALLLVSITSYSQRITLMYQDGLTHTTVKFAQGENSERYILGARNGKLWTKKLTDVAVYEADYVTIINTLQLALDFVNSDPAKTDSLIIDNLKVQYKTVALTKCVVLTAPSGITINTTKKVLDEVLFNIKEWENKKHTDN